MKVHGDIRRLERAGFFNTGNPSVHGDIRRLENSVGNINETREVHGDIRRLETAAAAASKAAACSWRHTPFRKI